MGYKSLIQSCTIKYHHVPSRTIMYRHVQSCTTMHQHCHYVPSCAITYHHVISCTTYQSFPINTSTIYNIIQLYNHTLPHGVPISQCHQGNLLYLNSNKLTMPTVPAERLGHPHGLEPQCTTKRHVEKAVGPQPLAAACYSLLPPTQKASSRISHSSGKLCSQWENSASSLQPLTVYNSPNTWRKP